MTVASPVTTPLVKITPTIGTGFSIFPLLLGLAIIVLSAVTLIIAGIVRRK